MNTREDCITHGSKLKTAVFSGRFDPPHVGHILTILKLACRYKVVLVVILDYKGREAVTARKAMNIFNAILSRVENSVILVTINKDHFAKITKRQYYELLVKNNINPLKAKYFAGNKSVIKRFELLGLNHKFIPRSECYSGTEIRKRMNEQVRTKRKK